jgi:hypothetical protein
MMSKKYVIAMALLGIFSISAVTVPTYASEANPYCDKVSDEYMESGGACHDRKDYYDGGPNNGLYPCNDGSARTDWKDCPDVSGFDYSGGSEEDDDKDNDGRSDSEPRELEEGESVELGEPTRGYTEDDGEIVEEEGEGEIVYGDTGPAD